MSQQVPFRRTPQIPISPNLIQNGPSLNMPMLVAICIHTSISGSRWRSRQTSLSAQSLDALLAQLSNGEVKDPLKDQSISSIQGHHARGDPSFQIIPYKVVAHTVRVTIALNPFSSLVSDDGPEPFIRSPE